MVDIAPVAATAADAELQAKLDEGIMSFTISMFTSLVQDAQKQEEERQAREKEMNQGLA